MRAANAVKGAYWKVRAFLVLMLIALTQPVLKRFGVSIVYAGNFVSLTNDAAAMYHYVRKSGHLATVKGRNPRAVKKLERLSANIAQNAIAAQIVPFPKLDRFFRERRAVKRLTRKGAHYEGDKKAARAYVIRQRI